VIRNKKVIAVILARAGSKGIPGKNYRDLLGKPLFWWSVEAALKSKYIDEVVVSSNCEYSEKLFLELLDSLSDEDGNRTGFIHRPEEISGDLSKNEDALIHTINYAYQEYEYRYDIVVNLQVTSPCRLDGLVDRCIEEYDDGGYNSLLTGTKDTPFLWQKKNGKWEYTVDRNDCCDRKMRQEFKEDEFTYHDNGNMYIVDTNVLIDTNCRIGDNPCVFETEGINSLQIDEEFDFELIEQIVKAKGLTTLI
jgi:N-acylneuraminate cytidylyltransferase/CMP-N,N'-diacetyllegionaminic acid synthase